MFLLLIHQQKMGYTPYRKAKKHAIYGDHGYFMVIKFFMGYVNTNHGYYPHVIWDPIKYYNMRISRDNIIISGFNMFLNHLAMYKRRRNKRRTWLKRSV